MHRQTTRIAATSSIGLSCHPYSLTRLRQSNSQRCRRLRRLLWIFTFTFILGLNDIGRLLVSSCLLHIRISENTTRPTRLIVSPYASPKQGTKNGNCALLAIIRVFECARPTPSTRVTWFECTV
ncbi:hypothetical protein FIBSPDRAFT_454869 [Athelia psychrophila]|uniref:Uncharacterized protein n=1 Tax=Athelia psychrophila TaxID=1759441 RepID=A0A167UB00_9AGAM|nr:hypothetical protein FIBSPDRAFT_454869 [Fibularhizoctonia sp. CBS 109695]